MQFIKFLIVGGINTGIYYIIYVISISLGFSYQLAVINATTVTIVISFLTFKSIVFKNNGYFFRFIILQIFNMLINILIIKFLRYYFNDYISGFISLMIIAVFSFLINKRYIFKR